MYSEYTASIEPIWNFCRCWIAILFWTSGNKRKGHFFVFWWVPCSLAFLPTFSMHCNAYSIFVILSIFVIQSWNERREQRMLLNSHVAVCDHDDYMRVVLRSTFYIAAKNFCFSRAWLTHSHHLCRMGFNEGFTGWFSINFDFWGSCVHY